MNMLHHINVLINALMNMNLYKIDIVKILVMKIMLIQKQEVFVIINVDIILIMILNIVHLNVQKNNNIL